MGKNRLLTNTAIYMLGSMLSKMLNILVLPYISIHLSTGEYGVYDLIQTLVGILLPVFTMQAIEAAFKFVYSTNDRAEKGRELVNVWAILIMGFGAFLIVFLLFNIWLQLDYAKYLVMYFCANILVNMFQRTARCYDNSKVYSVSGIIQTVVMLSSQFVCLQYFNLKEDGLIYSYVLSALVVVCYIELSVHSMRDCKPQDVSIQTIKKILLFSAPLIPNSICWWAVESLNRVLIVLFLGYSANGIYAMAGKFASIITMLTSTFVLAWQEYVLTEKENPKREVLFTNTFSVFCFILSCAVSGAILLQQIFFKHLIDNQYNDAFTYIPIIMITVSFAALNSFWGVGYFAYEKTKDAFKTTILGAASNFFLCIFLIRCIGLYGVAFSGLLSYSIMFIVRVRTMRAYFNIKIKIRDVISFLVIIGGSICIYYLNHYVLSIIYIFFICSAFVVRYYRLIMNMIKDKKLLK